MPFGCALSDRLQETGSRWRNLRHHGRADLSFRRNNAADDLFAAFGRVNCYYTVISLDDTANRNTCQYYHPIPQCTDADTRARREYTANELATYTAGDKFPAKKTALPNAAKPPRNPQTRRH